jgi:hypothetical protein
MTKFASLFAAVLLSTSFVACGGERVSQIDDENADLVNSGEPMDWVPAAKKAAGTVLGHPRLVHVEGTANSKGVYTWTFTFYGDVFGYANVIASSTGAKVHDSGHMVDSPMGAATIETGKVKFGVSDLVTLAAKKGYKGKCSQIELSEAVTAKPAPHWIAEFGTKTLAVNASTGAEE